MPCSKFVKHIEADIVSGVLIFLSWIAQTNHQKFHAVCLMVRIVDVVVLGKYNVVLALLIHPVAGGNFSVAEKYIRLLPGFPKT